jgi:hypothetical protein
MRCRNCHTVMMDTDTHCPGCHASVASATAAAPGPIEAPSPMLNMLPIFGGAIGGAIAGAIAASSTATAPSRPLGSLSYGAPSRRSPGPLRWMFGILFMLGGGLLLLIAPALFYDTWKLAQRTPQMITAAELGRKEGPRALAGAWTAYTFEESKPTGLTVTRRRLGLGGDVEAHCLLVRAEDKWLMATVTPAFEGNQLVGRLNVSPSKDLIQRVMKIEPSLLPYEFNGVDGSANDRRLLYIRSGWYAGFGLLGVLLGMRMVTRRQPALKAG